MQHHWLAWEELKSHFLKEGKFADGMRPEQEAGFRFVGEHQSATLEIQTGGGKSVMAATMARSAAKHFQKCVIVAPTKTIVEQFVKDFPNDFTVALGRNSYPCYYHEVDKETLGHEGRAYKYAADEVPTSLCRSCPHFVDMETGNTKEEGAAPCQYYAAKHAASVSRKPVLATLSYYLFSRLFSKGLDEPDLLIIDEAHRVAETVRMALSYDITDYNLERAVALLERVEEHEAAAGLASCGIRIIAIVKKKKIRRGELLDAADIQELIGILETIDASAIARSVAKAVAAGSLDAEDDMEALRKVESIAYNLRRYIRSLEYSLPQANRGALAYTYAYHVEEVGKRDKVEHKLVVCSHYVAPLIKQRLLGKRTVALSATIGDNEIFAQESGIRLPFLSVPPSFPPEKTRIYMPTDTPDLAFEGRKEGTVTNVMRRMARATKKLAKAGFRSLHIVVANHEREKLVGIMAEEGVTAVSYGNGVTAREAALKFKAGEGYALVGTAANFGEGVDLPRQIAPVIFALRPPYPPKDDPRAQFEVARYGNNRWAVWNWRVALAIKQWRGRNIRSEDDLGVTIFISQQFRRSVFAALPKALQASYKGSLTLDQCVKEAIELLG